MAESTRHRQAFDLYWRLGADRSIERLQEALATAGQAVALRTLYDWSSRYHWQSRIADLEREARRAEDSVRVAAIAEMQERHVKSALFLQQKGVEWLTVLGIEQVTAEAAIKALVEGIRQERLARGEATTRAEVQVDNRLQELTDEQLDALLERAHTDLAGALPPPS